MKGHGERIEGLEFGCLGGGGVQVWWCAGLGIFGCGGAFSDESGSGLWGLQTTSQVTELRTSPPPSPLMLRWASR